MSAALLARPDEIAPDVVTPGAIEAVLDRELAPLVDRIDRDGLYPGSVLRSLGSAGAYRPHVPARDGAEPDLAATVAGIAAAGETCLSTAFCMWCQSALAWYLWCSDNRALQDRLGPSIASGAVLGGTGLSNPMKTFFGIETMRLKGRRVEGGYIVKGALPWVSNLGPDHWFGAVFEREDGAPVMAAIACSAPGVTLRDAGAFLALDGTGTYGVQIRDAFVPDTDVLADPAQPYIRRIRGGFVLLQVGMGLGLARGCARLIRSTEAPLGHVNRFLEIQASDLEARIDGLAETVAALAPDAHDADPVTWRQIVEARLEASELAVSAAHNAMLHCGARGYVAGADAQRRLREAYFVAIVTPAVKQLKKMLAEMPA